MQELFEKEGLPYTTEVSRSPWSTLKRPSQNSASLVPRADIRVEGMQYGPDLLLELDWKRRRKPCWS